MKQHLGTIFTVIIFILMALSYFFIDWSKISIFQLFK